MTTREEMSYDNLTPAEEVLMDLLGTINVTGGLVRLSDGQIGCAGDHEWVDLATCVLDAVKVLRAAGRDVEVQITKRPKACCKCGVYLDDVRLPYEPERCIRCADPTDIDTDCVEDDS